MSTSGISSLTSSYLQQVLATSLKNAGVTTSTNSTSSVTQADSSQLSPFAQIVSTLQQLQQSDPSKYKQVTEQVATALQSAASTAQSDGLSAVANQFNQLSADFTKASQTGDLPNLQDLAQAVGGGTQATSGHHRHHHHHGGGEPASSSSTSSSSSVDSDSTSSSTSSTASSSASSANSSQSQLLSLFQTSDGPGAPSSQNSSTNPATIILNVLSNAGVGANSNS